MLGLSACLPKPAAQKKDQTVLMEVVQLDLHNRLGNKVADGQYLVARTVMKNTANKTVVMQPQDFVLQNITDKPQEQYSQPAERQMKMPFSKVYGKDLQDRVVDMGGINLYPRLQLERYFVFMVPLDADLNEYQITYRPTSLSVPLVSSATLINDHRKDAYYE